MLLLSHAQLLLQRLGHLGGRGAGQAEGNLHHIALSNAVRKLLLLLVYLDSIVNEPLQSGECTNHDDPGAESSPQTFEAQHLDGVTDAGAGRLVQVGDQSVGGVGHDGAEHARDVARGEGDHQLLGLAALGAGLGHHVLVESLHRLLEAGELHHGVGDLTAPQRHQGLVEAIKTLLSLDLGEGTSERGREGAHRGSLNSDLDLKKMVIFTFC